MSSLISSVGRHNLTVSVTMQQSRESRWMAPKGQPQAGYSLSNASTSLSKAKNMTSKTGGWIHFWAQHQLARMFYHDRKDTVPWSVRLRGQGVYTSHPTWLTLVISGLGSLTQPWHCRHIALSITPRCKEPTMPKLSRLQRIVQACSAMSRSQAYSGFQPVSVRGEIMAE